MHGEARRAKRIDCHIVEGVRSHFACERFDARDVKIVRNDGFSNASREKFVGRCGDNLNVHVSRM